MSLPRAIQQQVEAADSLVAQINGQTGGDPPETAENPANNPAISQPADPPQPISQETEPKPAPVPEETWERKYLTLKGMYDAEVPRLHAQLREVNTQVQTLIAENAAAKARTPEPAPAPAQTLITEQDREAFGPDLLDLIERATEQKLAGYRQQETQMRNEIAELKGKLGDVSTRQVVSDKDRYTELLGKAVPDWEALNVDQGFLTWLAEVDPVYGIPRQYALNNAYEALDAGRTASIFNQYKATLAPQPNPRPTPSLQSQVAPTRSRTSSAPSTAEAKRVYTQKDIATFYDEWIKGHLDNDEAAKIEQDINAAYVEGRIR